MLKGKPRRFCENRVEEREWLWEAVENEVNFTILSPKVVPRGARRSLEQNPGLALGATFFCALHALVNHELRP